VKLLPSRRFFALFAAASLLFLLGPLPALAADALLLAALLVDALLVPPRGQLLVTRRAPRRMSLGGSAEVTILIRNLSQRPVRLALTDDVPPALVREGAEVLGADVPPRGETTLRYGIRAERRGEVRLGDTHLRLLGPLGLARLSRRQRQSEPVLIQPGIVEVRRLRLLALHQRLRDAGVRNVRLRGEAGAFESLREYVAGDDPRTVDWKATARSRAVMVRQYEAERSQSVLIALDAGRLMTERLGLRERMDHALSAALLLADVAGHSGDRVGVLVFSDRIHQYLPPARVSLSSLSGAFARVEARLVEPNYPAAFGYLSRQLRRRSLLVLFTDVIDRGASSALMLHLTRAVQRHLPLVVALRNPALEAAASSPAPGEDDVFRRAAAEELLQARAAALASMRSAGVLVADVHPDESAPAVVNRYLEVKGRALL
jgi:uncharacterized protein (DUF58 family)